jgi:zinc/manganese transport system substrate-binding protein
MLNYAFQVAVMNNAEPSPSQTAAFEDSLKSGKAKVLFYNSQVTDKTTERLLKIAQDSKVPVVGVTETEPKGLTIQGWFAGQLNQVQTALSKQ